LRSRDPYYRHQEPVLPAINGGTGARGPVVRASASGAPVKSSRFSRASPPRPGAGGTLFDPIVRGRRCSSALDRSTDSRSGGDLGEARPTHRSDPPPAARDPPRGPLSVPHALPNVRRRPSRRPRGPGGLSAYETPASVRSVRQRLPPTGIYPKMCGYTKAGGPSVTRTPRPPRRPDRPSPGRAAPAPPLLARLVPTRVAWRLPRSRA